MDLSITNHPVTLAFIIALPLFGIVAKLFGATFQKIAKWYLYIAVFSVVVVMDSIFFPFIGGKDYFFRFTVELSLMATLLWWAFEARAGELKELIKANYKKPVVIAVTVFVAMVTLACIFAYDAHAAFWSNYERGEGGFQMLHYYVFFMLLMLLLRTEEDWKSIFRFSLVAAAGMIGYGILGNYSVPTFIGPYAGSTPPTTGWWHVLVDIRFQGSLGNPAYVAPYLLFSMFYGAYLWINRRAGAAKKALVHIGYAVLIAFFIFFFILSETRGAFIGLGAGVFVLLLYFIFAGRGGLRKWSSIALAILIVLGAAGYAVRNNPRVTAIPAARLLQISTSDVTAQTRFWVWGEAWKGFLERPIFGWGPENFTAVYDKFFDPRFFVPGQNTETWFDRAHSVFFDYLAETGALGLLSYLAIFFIFAWEFFKKKIAGMHAETGVTLTRGLMIALPVAYLVQGIAIFDVLPMYINLFLFMAFAAYYFSVHEHHNHHNG
jgi:hypothetical protein